VLVIEPRWWDTEELRSNPKFSKSNETGSYFDWDADFTEAEFRLLHEHFRPLATLGRYADSDWQKRIQPQLHILDAALAGGLGTIAKIHVSVYEWESGL
jgi:hypothetical protein